MRELRHVRWLVGLLQRGEDGRLAIPPSALAQVERVVQAGLDNWWSDTRVPSETVKGTQRSLDERTWTIDVPANGETTLTVQFDTRY